MNGHLAVLKWARANGCHWDEDTCAFAASNGHLTVLQWMRANGCPWNEYTCELAAKHGHLDVLQWARANGCPWDAEVLVVARENHNVQIIRWAICNGLQIPSGTEPAVVQIRERIFGLEPWRERLESALEYVKELGCPVSDDEI